MKNEIISFKGSASGVVLNIKGSDLARIKEELHSKIKESVNFYKGMKFLGVVGEDLSEEEILDLNLLLKYKYDMNISLEEITLNINEDYYRKKLEEESLAERDTSREDRDYQTKLVFGTLRSGQEVDYKGNIVVIGDVNPGCVLKAKGNIIVLGALKGIAYAGLDGDTRSVVAAYSLHPSQLRIGDIIVRAPDGEESWESKLPEVAKIINGEIIIEPYLPNK